MSLRTGGEVAIAHTPIINPHNLKIEGWYCKDHFSKETLVLLGQDIRDVINQGFVVDDHDVLAQPQDLIRLAKILALDFSLVGKPVYAAKQRLGKVSDFAVEVESLFIQKIYVSQPLVKNFSGGTLSVDRNQIIEITNRKIVIQDLLKPKQVNPTVTVPVTS